MREFHFAESEPVATGIHMTAVAACSPQIQHRSVSVEVAALLVVRKGCQWSVAERFHMGSVDHTLSSAAAVAAAAAAAGTLSVVGRKPVEVAGIQAADVAGIHSVEAVGTRSVGVVGTRSAGTVPGPAEPLAAGSVQLSQRNQSDPWVVAFAGQVAAQIAVAGVGLTPCLVDC